MKVLQLGKFYPIRGGVEKVMYDLMLGLSDAGVHCDMLCAATEGHPAAVIHVNSNATLFVIDTAIKLAGTMLAPGMIFKLRAIAGDYDVIHIHHPDPMATLALYLSGYKGKVILHWHSDIIKQKALLKLYKPLQSWLIKRANKIVGTTPVYVQESSFLQHVQHKIDNLPIGVNAIVAKPMEVEAIRNRYSSKIIVFSLGRLVEYKGYEFLIRAAQQLDDRFHIVIGGKGPLEDQLLQLIADLQLQEKVSMIGFVDDEMLANYFAAADIFCLSSIWKTEAFAIVQIEAMSCGKPVVSTKIPGSGVSWVNQHEISGLVVEPGDAEALALAIGRIGSDNMLYQNYAAGSLNRFQDYFTRDKMIEKCMLIYKQALTTNILLAN